MKQWFKFFHQVSVLLAGSIIIFGAYQAIPLQKWESQDYTLMGLAMLIVAGLFKGMGMPVLVGEELGKDSSKEPAVSVS